MAERIAKSLSDGEQDAKVKSIIPETERLSPLVVGIMRRAIQDIILQPFVSAVNALPTLTPQDWDLGIYFVGAVQDPALFGETAETFLHNKNGSQTKKNRADESLAFGAGAKSCLGQELIREVTMIVAKIYRGIDKKDISPKTNPAVTISADVHRIPKGVQGWIGWQIQVKPEQWAKDMGQLPT